MADIKYQTMKHNIIIIFIFAVLIAGAYFFCNTLYLSGQKNFDKAKINDLEMNASAVSIITAHFMNGIISCVEHAGTKLSERTATPSAKELGVVYDAISILDLPIQNLGFIDLDGTLRSIYPAAYSEAVGRNYSSYEFFQKCRKDNKLTASKVVSSSYSNEKLKDRQFFALISPVEDKAGIRTGYVIAGIGTEGLTNLIQLQKYVSRESHIKFYIVNPEYDQILCSPDNLQGKISDSGREDARNFVIAATKTTKKNSSALIDKGSKKLFITTSKVNLKDISLMVVASEPYIKTMNYSADSSRRIFLIIVFTFIILVLFILLIIYQKVVVKKLKRQITDLEIIIDRDSVREKTEMITQSDYFERLNERIKEIKNK